MARVSRPPGFDMTYRPTKATFLLPWRVRLPATLYFGVACSIAAAVLVAHFLPPSTWLYQNVVEADRYRLLTAPAFAALVFASAFASVIRQQLTGVIVRPDGIETREVIAFGLPRIRRLTWMQIDKIAIPYQAPETKKTDYKAPFRKIRLDLWNGSQEFLPDVARLSELSIIIERVALARAIPIEGGTGLLDELGDPFDDDEDP